MIEGITDNFNDFLDNDFHTNFISFDIRSHQTHLEYLMLRYQFEKKMKYF